MVFDALEDRLVAEMDQLTHEWHCSAARGNMWDEKGDDFEYHRKQADKTYKAIGRLTLPWYKWAEEMSVAELWKRFKEYEQDPEFRQWRKQEKTKLQRSKQAHVAEEQTLKAISAARKQIEQERAAKQRGKHGGLRNKSTR